MTTELTATLPKVRRRKPLPPGLKVALALVLWCHGWFVAAIVCYVLGACSFLALALWVANVAMAWAKPFPNVPPRVFLAWGCVHWLRRYWREWRDDR